MSALKYKEISDGVKLLCVNSDKFKTNCIFIDFYMPINKHLAALNVLASLMGHISKNYNVFKKFNAKLEGMYGADFETSSATIGERLRLRFSIEVPDDRFAFGGEAVSREAVKFLIDILENPHCTDGCFDKEWSEREIVFTLQTLEAEKNDKRSYAMSRLRQLMCAGEPYGIDRAKLEEDVKKLDGKKLFAAYEYMMKNANIFVTASGRIDEKMLTDEISAFAAGISERNPEKIETVFVEQADEIRYFKENMEVSQAKLVIGLRTGMTDSDDNYSAYKVMTDVFGGGPYSRLFLNVREKMSLCYYCSARLFREKGIIFIQCGVEKENWEQAVKEILNQLDIMKKGEFTDEDFASSISALSDAYNGVEDSPIAVCAFYGSQAFDGAVSDGAEVAETIRAVTREQVIKCAKRVTVDSIYLLAEGNENDE